VDYNATKVQEDATFSLTTDEELWAHGDGTITVTAEKQRIMTFGTTWHAKVVSYGDSREITVNNERVECPHSTDLTWATLEGQISVYAIAPLSRVPLLPKSKYKPSYDVLGACVLKGDRPRDIGPLHVPSIRGGRIHIEFTEAVLTAGDEYGSISIQSSHDGEQWFDLPNSGLSNNTLRIEQKHIHTGDTYGDEFSLTNHGEYIRVHYLPNKIAGKGFEATVTIETKR